MGMPVQALYHIRGMPAPGAMAEENRHHPPGKVPVKTESDGITVDAVARIVHNAQRDLGYWLEDPYPPEPYDALPEEQRRPVQSLVRLIIGGYPPEYVQEMWIESMKEKGWDWGEEKDPNRKTHPCITGFEELPLWERKKVLLAYDIVEEFRRHIDLS